MKRGEVYFADLGEGHGSEQGGRRPVLILQNNKGNQYSPTLIVACLTSKLTKRCIPTHVLINSYSLVLCEQLRTIDKSRVLEKLWTLTPKQMKKVDAALKVSLALEVK